MATATGSYATRSVVEGRIGGTFTTAEDTLIDGFCDDVNMLIERITGRVLAPIAGTPTYTYDGDNSRRLYLPETADGTPIGGIRTITTLELAYYTTSAYITVDSSQYFLRERSQPGAPYDALYFTDYALGPFLVFPKGYNTVRLTGTAGWAAIPDDIADLANAAAVSAWHARQNGSGQIGEGGETPGWTARYLSPKDRQTLRDYTLAGRLV